MLQISNAALGQLNTDAEASFGATLQSLNARHIYYLPDELYCPVDECFPIRQWCVR